MTSVTKDNIIAINGEDQFLISESEWDGVVLDEELLEAFDFKEGSLIKNTRNSIHWIIKRLEGYY